eukprot:TRINITY_DN493_c0_g2_i1.p1 TRINITY_DN493_c0_g2~~TRINITY_DN493_c0_g2_i1.p1  ORF type:complete len:249 (+),score=63.94 TRINITY_DN493_c0_g2_i1:11-757(+)
MTGMSLLSLPGRSICTRTPSRGLKSIPFIKPYYPPRRGSIQSEWRSKKSYFLPIQKLGPPEEFTKWDQGFQESLKFSSQTDSLKTRGFRRSYKPYQPAQDVDQIILEVLGEVYELTQGTIAYEVQLNADLEKKTRALTILADKTGHRVPNSLLHFMSNGEELLEFYRTPIDMNNFYDRLSTPSSDLPKNLHALKDYIRFDPKESHPLHAVSAYPRSSTIITTPETKRKYKGHVPKHSPYDDNTREMEE